MNLSIIIKDDKQDLGIYLGEDNINILVNGISDIYPKMSKKYEKLLKIPQNQYNNDTCHIDNFQLYKEVIKLLEQKIKDGDCNIIINSSNSNCLKMINEVFYNGCIIDINNVEDKKIKTLLNDNQFNNKIKFKDKYNGYSLLTCDEVLTSYDLINKIKEEIQNYDLTPLEKVILLYDMVRKKSYKDYDSDDYSVSRDIAQILNNDYVVCEGYANIISAVCNALNIDCDKMIWYPSKGETGHATNLVYINDPYYDVHQFFEIDATMCSKLDQNDHEYINDYKYFLVPLEIAVRFKKKLYGLLFKDHLDVKVVDERYERMEKFIKLDAPELLKENCIRLFLKSILKIVEKIDNKDLKLSYEKTKEELKNNPFDLELIKKLYEEYKKLTVKRIKKNTMTEALYKVKRIEYLMDPNEYKLDVELFKNMINDNFPKSQEEKLLEVIFNEVDSCFVDIDFLKNLQGNNPNERAQTDINRIKLLKILKDELESRKGKVNVKK